MHMPRLLPHLPTGAQRHAWEPAFQQAVCNHRVLWGPQTTMSLKKVSPGMALEMPIGHTRASLNSPLSQGAQPPPSQADPQPGCSDPLGRSWGCQEEVPPG